MLIFNLALAGLLILSGSQEPQTKGSIELNSSKIEVIPMRPGLANRPRCMELGPFNAAQVQTARRLLAEMALGNRLTSADTPLRADWWVFIPPFSTYIEAQKRASVLEKLGIHDYRIVEDNSQWKYAISLGLFRTADAAGQYQSALSRKGVKGARVGQQDPRVMTRFYLKDADAATIARLTEVKAQFANAELKQVACPVTG